MSRDSIIRNAIISTLATVTLASCTTIKSTTTYKAISQKENCKLSIAGEVWVENEKLDMRATSQRPMLSVGKDFTDSELENSRLSSIVLIKDFKYNTTQLLSSKLGTD